MENYIFQESLTIVAVVKGREYKLEIHPEWFLKDSVSATLFLDQYGRAGTSRVWSAIQFKITIQILNSVYITTGIEVAASQGDAPYTPVMWDIIAIDGDFNFRNHATECYNPGEETLEDKVTMAIKQIKAFASMCNPVIAYSGGKDSVLLAHLVRKAGVTLQMVYNNTTIDPPQTLSFVKQHNAIVHQPNYTFLELVEKKGFPTMFRRFCCKELKERYIADNILIGVRQDESVKRKKRYCAFEDDMRYSARQSTHRLAPMIYFTDDDVKAIITKEGLECHPIYYDENERFHVERRLGCIGCPLQGDRGVAEFKQYPRLLRQIIKRGIMFHERMGRTAKDAYENITYNLFYSNHGLGRYEQTYKGLFQTDAKEFLEEQFNIKLP